MSYLTGRCRSQELMDDPHADRAEIAAALAYLRAVNHRLGGTRMALDQFKKWSRDWPKNTLQRPIRILDVGTGSADVPLAIAKWAQRAGWRVNITAVDLHPITVQLAREYLQRAKDHKVKTIREPELEMTTIAVLQADALKLMDLFEPGEFDYAHAGLFLHHLNDVQAMTVLKTMDRLSKRGVIWNDLVRGWVGRVGVRLLMLGPRVPRIVKHDAVASVRAGFTKHEALDLAQRAGLERLTYRTHLMHRFTLVSEKSMSPSS